jgi:class 3 adenylate cyclase
MFHSIRFIVCVSTAAHLATVFFGYQLQPSSSIQSLDVALFCLYAAVVARAGLVFVSMKPRPDRIDRLLLNAAPAFFSAVTTAVGFRGSALRLMWAAPVLLMQIERWGNAFHEAPAADPNADPAAPPALPAPPLAESVAMLAFAAASAASSSLAGRLVYSSLAALFWAPVIRYVYSSAPVTRPLACADAAAWIAAQARKAIVVSSWTVYPAALLASSRCHATVKLCEAAAVLVASAVVDVHIEEMWIDHICERSRLVDDLLPASAVRGIVNQVNFSQFLMNKGLVVMFSDIVNYTRISSETRSDDVVLMLSKLFGRFDEIVIARGITKVETVGDAYMTVCDGSLVSNMVLAARDMLRAARRVSVKSRRPREPLPDVLFTRLDDSGPPSPPRSDHVQLRIGMHVGDVYSGIISRLLPRYCYIGDAINTASRMQSGGASMRIHVSDAMKRLIESSVDPSAAAYAGSKRARFIFIDAGVNSYKGKGHMQSWFIEVDTGSMDFKFENFNKKN